MTTTRKVFDVRFTLLVTLNLVTLAVCGLSLYRTKTPATSAGTDGNREVAARLAGAGLNQEALIRYEKVLETPLNGPERAQLAFATAELYEKEAQPEKALAWYFETEAAPDSPAELRPEAKKRIVALLESLGKATAAKQALAESTALGGGQEAPKGSVTVATIGAKKIYLQEVQSALDDIPATLRKDVDSSPAGRAEFLKRYVAEEVLKQKAERLGVGDSPEFIKRLEAVRRQLLVQKIIEGEVLSKITIDETDLKNYFESHKEKYATKDKAQPKIEDVRKAVEGDYRMMKSQAQYQKVVEESLANESVKLFPESWR